MPPMDTPDDTTKTRVRGRPRAFDRDAALFQAMRTFWLKGYGATSITDLTDAMGIGSPSLYAAFGSKEALYAEALRHYGERYENLVWGKFFAASTAREAVLSWLLNSAAILSGSVADNPLGCMVTLSSVATEGHKELGALVQSARALPFERLKTRISQAISDGEIPASSDAHALARYIQTVQNGMSIQARDGVSGAELEAVAHLAMLGWDARTASE
ncbi:MAG: TetR/AcrR family transcriptional regulator [Gammaproteobacteria bacterium]|nr:TetR/AcrR family transcriptional regulator [Gammaproteobacteria bacterium]MBU1488815.1 TetR/AcrR family transcriptional regulator [Gammaproteobacteria bacterium]MBU2218079.1 TetR/AcrR family transcriptional regulator [Gammaproteobacteria bacterium]MBU2322691.1 TetR/AcrR family transcriptional regulator [Gammaproteobacteria bacterium]